MTSPALPYRGEQDAPAPRRRVIRAGQGEVLGPPAGVRDRYLVDASDAGGGAAVVEHLLAPRSMAGPLHRHTREDEFSYVLQGRVHIQAGDDLVIAEPGELVFKPRHEWHTFWNADDEPARLLEIIVPGGLEAAFRVMATDPDVDIVALAAAYGADIDLRGTEEIVERYGLTFG
ncbi:MAG: cupin domain-containing protein [Actinotalea sp.]|nr:cupin domain-containing protein [Actinotalea sp.]